MKSSFTIDQDQIKKRKDNNLIQTKIFVLKSDYDIRPIIQLIGEFGCHCKENSFNHFRYFQKGVFETQNFHNLEVYLDRKALTSELSVYFEEKLLKFKLKSGRSETLTELIYEWKRMFENRYIVLDCFKCKKNRRLYINRSGKHYMLPYETELEHLVSITHRLEHLQFLEIEELLSSAGYGYPSFHSLIRMHIMKECNHCRY